MAICRRCNNNDIRDILDMMNQEWGKEHINTNRLKNILIDLKKVNWFNL